MHAPADFHKELETEKIPKKLVRLARRLPVANYNLLKFFVDFLARVCKHSGANRMGARNLALIFGASLINPPVGEAYDLLSIKSQCELIEHMINQYSFIFEGNGEAKMISHTKSVATIPAGAPSRSAGSSPLVNKEKRRFLERPQFNSSRLGLGLNRSTPDSRLKNLVSTGDAESARKTRRKKREEPEESPSELEPL